MENNNHFTTEDILLAVYLRNNGVRYIGSESYKRFKSRFTFVRLPDKEWDKLISRWLMGDSGTREIVEIYRHLVRDAKSAQDRLAVELGVS